MSRNININTTPIVNNQITRVQLVYRSTLLLGKEVFFELYRPPLACKARCLGGAGLFTVFWHLGMCLSATVGAKRLWQNLQST